MVTDCGRLCITLSISLNWGAVDTRENLGISRSIGTSAETCVNFYLNWWKLYRAILNRSAMLSNHSDSVVTQLSIYLARWLTEYYTYYM